MAWDFPAPEPLSPWYRRWWTNFSGWYTKQCDRSFDWAFSYPLGTLAIWVFSFYVAVNTLLAKDAALWHRILVTPGTGILALCIVAWCFLVYTRLRLGKEGYKKLLKEKADAN
jgi:tellurite resistance protein TehA-like permease